MEQEAKVFVIDDDETLCSSLKWFLESNGFKVETYHSATAFLAVYNQKLRGCLLIDISMPDMNGLQLQEKLKSLNNKIPIIIMTGYAEVPLAVQTMKAGAIDFVTKPFDEKILNEQIKYAFSVDNKRNENFQFRTTANLFKMLTSREQEVLKKVVDGKLNKQIACELNISIKTVELHRSNVMRKMQASSLAELVKMYLFLQTEYSAELL